MARIISRVYLAFHHRRNFRRHLERIKNQPANPVGHRFVVKTLGEPA